MIAHVVSWVSIWAIPLFLLFVPVYGALRKVKVYECFVEGAKEGFQVAVRIIPYMVAMLVAVGMFRSAGGVDWLILALEWGPRSNAVAWANQVVSAYPNRKVIHSSRRQHLWRPWVPAAPQWSAVVIVISSVLRHAFSPTTLLLLSPSVPSTTPQSRN